MTTLFTSIRKADLDAKQRRVSSVVASGQAIIGMKPATQHANPCDLGGLAL